MRTADRPRSARAVLRPLVASARGTKQPLDSLDAAPPLRLAGRFELSQSVPPVLIVIIEQQPVLVLVEERWERRSKEVEGGGGLAG